MTEFIYTLFVIITGYFIGSVLTSRRLEKEKTNAYKEGYNDGREDPSAETTREWYDEGYSDCRDYFQKHYHLITKNNNQETIDKIIDGLKRESENENGQVSPQEFLNAFEGFLEDCG